MFAETRDLRHPRSTPATIPLVLFCNLAHLVATELLPHAKIVIASGAEFISATTASLINVKRSVAQEQKLFGRL